MMSNIFAQMNPVALIAVAVLLLLSLVGAVVLRLIRKGRAKTPRDLIAIARERSAAVKETKAATKRADVANAQPVAADRLSRISAKGMAEASAARIQLPADEPAAEENEHPALAAEWQPPAVSDEPADHGEQAYGMDVDENGEIIAEYATEYHAPIAYGVPAPYDAPAPDDAFFAEDTPVAQTAVHADYVDPAPPFAAPEELPAAPIDLADPGNHPTDWDGLLAIVDRLDTILAQPWHDDALAEPLSQRLAAARAAAGDDADTDLSVRALSRDLAAFDLARTINNAAREQAAEIVAAVREFAHQQSFSSADCAAVLNALRQIEWMALIARGDSLERRTLPLTRHDPDAPLWVAEAWDDLRTAENRAAA